ncbi:MAG TPA: helix-turn-helix domain-containing protein [Solirubrobacteraceae bacterium]|nr:helix-turn-helix domain-containing protein [Solirubrobacteraceae bacterium]
MASAQRRGGATTAKRAAVQAAVLRATEELLAEGASYAELGVERIATRAGISRTAFYFYFADKRELLMRLTEDVTALLLEQADIWWSGDGDATAQLRVALANVAELYDEHAVLLRAVVEVSTYDEEVARFWRGLIGQFVEATRRRIEHERETGRSTCASPGPVAFALTWMVERTYYQQLVQGDAISRDEALEALTEVWVRTIYGA